jgi:hypothetical protein
MLVGLNDEVDQSRAEGRAILGYVGDELIVTSWQPCLDGVQVLVWFSSRNRSDFS